jgi:hypothetical protein
MFFGKESRAIGSAPTIVTSAKGASGICSQMPNAAYGGWA